MFGHEVLKLLSSFGGVHVVVLSSLVQTHSPRMLLHTVENERLQRLSSFSGLHEVVLLAFCLVHQDYILANEVSELFHALFVAHVVLLRFFVLLSLLSSPSFLLGCLSSDQLSLQLC